MKKHSLGPDYVHRRDVLRMACSALLLAGAPALRAESSRVDTERLLSELELRAGGRLGVSVVELESGRAFGHRADERFGMCSTFKLPLAAFILMDAQEGRIDLGTRVHYTKDDMVFYAPVAEANLERGYMTMLELAQAAQTTSDNVAANLLLRQIGGPEGFTERLRAIGDETTRLDRYEPEMNLVPPGEVRDTTTPGAMAQTVRVLLSGSVLGAEETELLQSWMQDTRTGLKRLRAGFPKDWKAGDKTGTGIASVMPNQYNDVAVAWPVDGTPDFVVAAYYAADKHYDRMRDGDVAVLRAVGELSADSLAGSAAT